MAKKSKTEANGASEPQAPVSNPGEQHIVIQGHTFSTKAPYSEGHVVSANEAAVLNQTLAENLRNNFAKTVAKVNDIAKAADRAVTQDELDALQAEFDKYAEGYVFGVRRATRAPADPVLREATKLASAAIRAMLKKRNVEVSDEKFDELVDQLLASRPQYKEEAQRRIDALKSAGAESLEDLGLSV